MSIVLLVIYCLVTSFFILLIANYTVARSTFKGKVQMISDTAALIILAGIIFSWVLFFRG